MPAEHELRDGGWSRRQLLARSAVAAGVVWAAPVIRTTAAYATSAAGTERPCTQFFWCWIDMLGTREVRLQPTEGRPDPGRHHHPSPPRSRARPTRSRSTPTRSRARRAPPPPPRSRSSSKPAPPVPQTIGPDPLPPAVVLWQAENPDVPLSFAAIPPMLTQTSDQAWAVLIPEVTGAQHVGAPVPARARRLARGEAVPRGLRRPEATAPRESAAVASCSPPPASVSRTTRVQ